MPFVIVDRFGNLWGVFDGAVAAARWAIAKFGEDGWRCVPMRASDYTPPALTEGERRG